MTMNRCPLWVQDENGKKLQRALMVLPVNMVNHTQTHTDRVPPCPSAEDTAMNRSAGTAYCVAVGRRRKGRTREQTGKTVGHVVETQAGL